MQFNISELEGPFIRVNKFLLDRKNNKAIKDLNKILDENPSNDQAWLLLGIAKRRIGNYKEAVKCFSLATQLNNSILEAWGLLTITYLDLGNRNKAEQTIQKAAELNPNDEKIQFYKENLIRVYKKFGPFF